MCWSNCERSESTSEREEVSRKTQTNFYSLEYLFSIQTLVTFDTINSYYGPSWIVKPDKTTVESRVNYYRKRRIYSRLNPMK